MKKVIFAAIVAVFAWLMWPSKSGHARSATGRKTVEMFGQPLNSGYYERPATRDDQNRQ
jgi:hypothetical protein